MTQLKKHKRTISTTKYEENKHTYIYAKRITKLPIYDTFKKNPKEN